MAAAPSTAATSSITETPNTSTASTTINTSPQNAMKKKKTKKPLKIVFIHLDLGIGGAEQLVLQLATASQDLGHSVAIATTRCDQDHCFQAVQHSDGRLASNVYIYGNWIPPNVLGGIATALCSTLRMLYISWQVTRQHRDADVVVVDVLPTSIPLLLNRMPRAGVLFYCHFPDKLLLRNQGGTLKKVYRTVMDALEETTMALADTLVVNSKFTHTQVQATFPKLNDMRVLYPALDTSRMTEPNRKVKCKTSPIVSLNRFERKKNIELLIHAYAYLKKEYPSLELPPLIIAGGYDIQNVENVEYRGELQGLVDNNNNSCLGVTVDFRMDISDGERAELFQTALCVVYTPDREHFGIVPLEAMYAETPVIAVNSGGPVETVKDDVTGFLRDPTPKAFGEALRILIEDPAKATDMGRAGRTHVEETFGTKRLEAEWKALVEETSEVRPQTRPRLVLWTNTAMYLVEAAIAIVLCLLVTWLLRLVGILGPNQSILGALRNGMGDEL
jgi:alpha-1,3/alpha-1,6-mannosyltransferase